jgi:hypothetical protein
VAVERQLGLAVVGTVQILLFPGPIAEQEPLLQLDLGDIELMEPGGKAPQSPSHGRLFSTEA